MEDENDSFSFVEPKYIKEWYFKYHRIKRSFFNFEISVSFRVIIAPNHIIVYQLHLAMPDFPFLLLYLYYCLLILLRYHCPHPIFTCFFLKFVILLLWPFLKLFLFFFFFGLCVWLIACLKFFRNSPWRKHIIFLKWFLYYWFLLMWHSK